MMKFLLLLAMLAVGLATAQQLPETVRVAAIVVRRSSCCYKCFMKPSALPRDLHGE